MDKVATPQPRQMPSSPAKTGLPIGRQMPSTMPVLAATVLSVGTYKTSLSVAACWQTEDRSLESEKGYWVTVRPAASSSDWTTSTWYWLLASAEQ